MCSLEVVSACDLRGPAPRVDCCGVRGEQACESLVSSLQAYNGHHQALEVLLQSLVDLDIRDEKGRTALDLAAFKGHTECVEALINQGASIFVKDTVTKRTPLHASGRSRRESGGRRFAAHLPVGRKGGQRLLSSQFFCVDFLHQICLHSSKMLLTYCLLRDDLCSLARQALTFFKDYFIF